ncbi:MULTISPECIES: VOC family protein [unclassified Cryobacterium]|uniref:bleomycin resistance protein n=1 Tax=unclassified Cryobacterium TaxID=2649013 RepID=UPI0018ED9A24|nr:MULTISPECIES: VOC family protein [unclassified Cryobacterium]
MTDECSMLAPDLVPELLVTSLQKSLDFWCRLSGFDVLYDRPDDGFAYITRGTAHLMLERRGAGRNWIPAALDPPFGRGVNFQVSVPSIDPLVCTFREARWPLFMEPETKWYRTGDTEAGVAQFLVQDPDGYLIRFQASIGRRIVAAFPRAP